MVERKLGLLLATALVWTGCGACRKTANVNGNVAVQADAPREMTTPPFQTKEPAKYQAQIVIATTLVNGQSAPLGPPLATVTQFVARDGDKRRLDYEVLPGVKTVILNTPAGSFLLLPQQKIYAEVKPEKATTTGKAGTEAQQESLEDFAPEKLLNPQLPGARHEKLGAEIVNGRAATKYRTLVTSSINGQSGTTETFLWIDEALGLPVKEESTSAQEGLRRTLEYRDIKTEVNAALFDIPKDYRKVTQQELQTRARPGSANLSGRDRDELPHDETHLQETP